MRSDEEDAAVSESDEEYDDDAEEEEEQMEEDPESMRRRNTSAMLSNNLVVERQPLMPRVLKVDAATVLRAAFKSPLQGAPDASGAKQTLEHPGDAPLPRVHPSPRPPFP